MKLILKFVVLDANTRSFVKFTMILLGIMLVEKCVRVFSFMLRPQNVVR